MTLWDGLWTDKWWLEYGLDGIVAGLVGGLVTGGAVWATIRHERRLREESDLDRRREEARRALVTLYATLTSEVPHEDWPTANLAEYVRRLVAEFVLAQGSVGAVSSEMEGRVESLHGQLVQVIEEGRGYDAARIAHFRDDLAPDVLWDLIEELAPGTVKRTTT